MRTNNWNALTILQTLKLGFSFFLVTVAVVWTPTAAEAQTGTDRAARKLEVAHEVFQEFVRLPERQVPARLLAEAKCLAVVPNVIKGAFVWGGRRGRGVMTCRQADGGWSPISFVRLTGGSFGLQIGAESADLLFFFVTDRGARSLIESKFILGGEASVSAGPLGRNAEINTDLKLKAEIFTYAKSRGVFAGLAVEGAQMAPDRKWNQRFYGTSVAAQTLLFGDSEPSTSPAAEAFLAALP